MKVFIFHAFNQEIPTESDPDAHLKDLRVKITENNYKLCLFAERKKFKLKKKSLLDV